MYVQERPIDSIRPYDRNPRINDQAVEAVAASIRAFGFRQPIVVDDNGIIIAGHTRYLAALRLGLKKVPVHVARGLTEAQVKAYRIADNKTAELAEWDDERLRQELAELKELDFNLDLLGFSVDELGVLLDDLKPGLVDPDDLPAPPDAPITRPGDLWILGNHRLLCADAGKPEDVDRLLDGASVHLVNTDPPYGVHVEPRSNNAIASGLSSFQSNKHHQRFDVVRYPEKAKPTPPEAAGQGPAVSQRFSKRRRIQSDAPRLVGQPGARPAAGSSILPVCGL